MKVGFAWSARRVFAAAMLVGLCAPAALAQSWSEPRYNPDVGSRWRIESRFDSEQTRAPHGHTWLHSESVADLTIDKKLADGFRISYVIRKINITGNGPLASTMDAALGAMQGVLVHARTDAAGRPVTVENVDKVRATMHKVFDRIIASFADKPREAAMIKQIMRPMLIPDGPKATTIFLGNLPRLARAQDTGLQPGEVRRVARDMKNPFGGPPLKATVTTLLAAWDNAARTARILRQRELEPGALKAATLAMMRKLAATSGKPLPPKMIEMFKKFDLQTDSETTIDVKNGMARRLEMRSSVTATGFGRSFRKDETSLVTVTRLPN